MSRKTAHQQRVEKFMEKAGQELPPKPVVPSESVRLLRAKLIFEEALETIQALGIDLELRYYGAGAAGEIPIVMKQVLFKPNARREISLVDIADGCADVSVVTIGTLSACGIRDDALLSEVDRSNLAKFRGDAHRDPETGKWIKPSDWQPPNIQAVLDEQLALLS